jgi:phenylalanyl-tRNA synthetase alpha subunit
MHPKVLSRGGIEDPVSWPALGFGIERLIMIKYGLKNIREVAKERTYF